MPRPARRRKPAAAARSLSEPERELIAENERLRRLVAERRERRAEQLARPVARPVVARQRQQRLEERIAAKDKAAERAAGNVPSLLKRGRAGVLAAKQRAYEDGTWSDTYRCLAQYEDFAVMLLIGKMRDGVDIFAHEPGTLLGPVWQEDGRVAPPDSEVVEVYYWWLLSEAYERPGTQLDGYAPSTADTKLSSLGRYFRICHTPSVDIVARAKATLPAVRRGLAKVYLERGGKAAEARSRVIMGALLRQLLDKARAERSWEADTFSVCAACMFTWLLRFGEAGRGAGQSDDNAGASAAERKLMTRICWERLVFLTARHTVIPFAELEARQNEVEWVDWGFGREKADRVYGGQIRSAQRNRARPWYCVVALLVAYAVRSIRAGAVATDPVFMDRSKPKGKRGLTNKVMNALLRKRLIGCTVNGAVIGKDIDVLEYSSHGFRAGSCTELFHLGVPVDRIKMLGRWKSDAYEAYRQIAREIFGELAQSIVNAPERHVLDQ